MNASQIWQKFSAFPGASVDGNVGIASQNAIGGLIQLLQKRSPHKILEIGAGIGTLTYTILNWARSTGVEHDPSFTFMSVENNDYCIGQLANNLRGFEGAYSLISSTEEARNSGQLFDLITIDGGGDIPNDMGFMNFDHLLQKNGAIFIEGTRYSQREKIREWYGNRKFSYTKMESYQQIIKSRSNHLKAKNKSYHLYIFEPNVGEFISYQISAFWNRFSVRVVRKLNS